MIEKENIAYQRRRKWLAAISLVTILLLTLLITGFVWQWLASFSQEDFREYILSFGVWSWLFLLVLQCLQVFIALIPGELLESAAGFVFGPIFGTAICYAGIALASAAVFWLTRRFGIRLVEVFISREKIQEMGFLKNAKKRNLLVFLFFFIPGTPKDLLTYFAGLTDIPFGTFLMLSMVARIPSVLSSTFGGHLLGEGQYVSAVILYAVTGIISLAGLFAYNLWRKKKHPD